MKVSCLRLLTAGLALASSAAVVRADSNSTVNDVKALNYALQLEHLEAAFYTRGLQQFPNLSDFPSGVRDYLELIKAHEAAHVGILSDALGAQASQACIYSFSEDGFTDVNQFLSTAITLEDIGVSAYVAALNHLSDQSTQQVAATIATIEARHAAYLRNAVGSSANGTNVPFPDKVNPELLPAQVLSKAKDFFVSCPYNLTANLPTLRPAGVAIALPPNGGSSNPNAATPSSATPTNPPPTYTQAQFNADVDVLQYALTLEYLEADFYQTFFNRFDAAAFNTVSSVNGQGANVEAYVKVIAAHEVAHVQALQAILTSRGQTPRTPGCYNWTTITTPSVFLQTAALLENTGVKAYDGAANRLTDTNLQELAAAVAVVEARHAAYLNVLTGKNATNQEFKNGNLDETKTPDEIVAIVTGLSPYVVGGAIFNCANNAQNAGSSGSFVPVNSGSSSSTGSNRPTGSSSTAPNGGDGGNGASTLGVSAFASAALAFVAALLF